ncbi:MAG: hypothetical protein K6G36_03535 [Candidatus Saccharibacteria bacterium]|nr:hypothetical protein [Candidatus Saccharibacteria bacterium]
MGIIVNKEDDKNDALTARINADLREKMQTTSAQTDDPDLVEDTDYVKEYKKTSHFGWVWIVLIALAILSLIFIVFF